MISPAENLVPEVRSQKSVTMVYTQTWTSGRGGIGASLWRLKDWVRAIYAVGVNRDGER